MKENSSDNPGQGSSTSSSIRHSGIVNSDPTMPNVDNENTNLPPTRKTWDEESDKIYYLSVGDSDSTIVQSNGRFGLIDASNASEYGPFPNTQKNGKFVAQVLKNLGVKHLDFVIATHNHSDHIGGIIDLAEDYNKSGNSTKFINSDTTYYFKPYHKLGIEFDSWGNREYQEKALELIQNAGAKTVDVTSQGLSKISFKLGDFIISLWNLNPAHKDAIDGENDNSIITLLQKNKISSVIMADLSSACDAEISNAIKEHINGPINMLRLSHHGYANGSSKQLLYNFNPKAAVASRSSIPRPEKGTYFHFLKSIGAKLFSTAESQIAIIQAITGDIQLHKTFIMRI